MTLFITSSPYLNHADRPVLNEANGFVERMRGCLPPNPRALFVCSSPDRRDLTCLFGADTVYAFAQAGMAFSSYRVLDGLNAQEAETLVRDSDLLILAGGHVPTQNAFFRAIHLREILQNFSGTVMGISAGSMNMADSAYIQPEDPGESDPAFTRFRPGLGLTDVNILPHYQMCRDDILDGMRLYEDITYPDSLGHTFYALPDGSYIFQDEHGQLLCGEGRRLKNGIMELLTLEGETLDLAELC